MESQVQVARVFDAFSQSDRDMMDIRINLANEKNFAERALESDVLILGPGLLERTQEIAHTARGIRPDLEIILFVSDERYSGQALREALSARVRKVIPISAPPLDLLQELVQISEQNRQKGNTRDGRLIVVTQVKGGLGATSLCAAVGEAAGTAGKNTLLWDLDIESKDLSRALLIHEGHGSVISSWMDGSREVSRDSLEDAIVSLHSNASLLTPPDNMASCMDLLAQLDGINIARKVTDLARVAYDCIIVDTCGRMSPLSGALMRAADHLIVLLDDSVLGLSAVPGFMHRIEQYILSPDIVRFLCAGTKMKTRKISAHVDQEGRYPQECWDLPQIPFDPEASSWPGTGTTLFTSGNRKTRDVISEITGRLGIYSAESLEKRTGSKSRITRFKSIFWNKGQMSDKTPIPVAPDQRSLEV